LEIIVADNAGFCSGVKTAIKSLIEQVEIYQKGSTLGPIVHNEDVVKYLQELSIDVVAEPEEATGAFLAVRTHGVTPAVLCAIKQLEGVAIIDLTCPRVRNVQKIAADLQIRDISIIILGDKDHPEVAGLKGWAGDKAIVVSSLDELEMLSIEPPAALIAQTTCDQNLYKKARELFNIKAPGSLIYDTLCQETKLRQEEIKELAQRVEAFIVVGSKSSANTKTLFDCCRQLKPSCLVTNAGELDLSFLRQHRQFAITAGASTPPWTIKEVVERMENETAEVKKEEQFSFEDEVKVAQIGEQVSGKVARVTEEEAYIDIGAKTEAILPAGEVHLDEGKTLMDCFTPEDDIEVTVLETDEQEGKVVVSHKRLARDKRLKELENELEDEVVLEGKVKQVVSAGIVVDLGEGVEGFMPGSLVDTKYIPDFNVFKDQIIEFKIQEYDREKNKVILNRRKIIEADVAKRKEETIGTIEAGMTITGTVKRLTDFGAFVDIGGIDGLVHISELSWERVKHPGELLQVGSEVEVKVLEVVPEKERISLSIRKTQPDPWTKTVEDLEVGQLVTGKITRLVNFGAFIEIRPGVEGLAHISQLADYHIKHPSEVLKEGEQVEVKVIEIKPGAKRISLSLKEARGVMFTPGNGNENDSENGNVTLGDLFGDLFEQEDLVPEEEPELVSDTVKDNDPEGGRE